MDFVFGVDVYAYNKPLDWAAARDAGMKFAFVKASENNFTDTGFADNWRRARDAGVLRGAYHFFHPEVNNAAQQANVFIQAVGADLGELPPVLDLETIYERRSNGEVRPIGLPIPSVILNRVKTWLDTVEAAFGRKPIIYSREEFLRSNGITAAWTRDYPLWLAQYPLFLGPNNKWVQISDPNFTPVPTQNMPKQPAGFQPWKFWQYSDRGRLNGYPPNENVDFNYFNGTLDDLFHFAGMTAPAPIEYTVKAGDSLPLIAKKHNVDLSELLTLNNDKLIQPGKKLIIPAKITLPPPTTPPPPPPPPTNTPIRYAVQPGDTLSGIATRFRTTIAAIMALNPQITNPNIIVAGDTLLIPRV
ncbi:MAG: LysM peptidoglycan-binding domain-containing protein [Chloroflexi bacterium]|nr:LysM peptidoglycan-binding domain-containing protein [Chloroflexota bacterium]